MIFQKCLIAGHTQMECDSIHSAIERKVGAVDIFTERDYKLMMQAVRVNPRPYLVKQFDHLEFMKMSDDSQYMKSIRPGRQHGEPNVHHLRGLKYIPSDAVFCTFVFWH